jgi:cation-transporting P-type ATPase C
MPRAGCACTSGGFARVRCARSPWKSRSTKLPGVRAVHAHPRTASVVVWYSPTLTERADILAAIVAAEHVPIELLPVRAPRSADVINADVLRMAVGDAALAVLGLRRYGFGRPPLLGRTGRLVATGTTIATGYPFMRGALRSLRGGGAMGTDALVAAATVASLVLRENVVALTVLWLLNIGEYLQDLTLRRTRRAISDLLRGNDDTAWIRTRDGTEVQVAVASLQPGDEVVVHDHVAIPVDGMVLEGEAIVDQSAITGETLPVSVGAEARIHAGSVVLRGRMVVRVSAVGSDTALGRIITRVEQAQRDRAPIQTVGEDFCHRFVPASFLLSAVTLALTRDVRRAMTMLLVACPCAVGLATPTAIGAPIGNGARRGILVKGGSHLEQAGRVDAVIFDKTGTLTIGRPTVTNIVALQSGWDPEQVLAYAAIRRSTRAIHLVRPWSAPRRSVTSRFRRTNNAKSLSVWGCELKPTDTPCCWAAPHCSPAKRCASPEKPPTGSPACNGEPKLPCCLQWTASSSG